jgi:hypothetical protein
MPQTEVKYFTPEEAQKTLPLVRQIVGDILNHSFQIKNITDFNLDNDDAEEKIEFLTSKINSFIKELDDIGCIYKDWNFEIGIVDFPSIINDEEVLLCWRSDEEDIVYYHGMDDGFIGRKLIHEENI